MRRCYYCRGSGTDTSKIAHEERLKSHPRLAAVHRATGYLVKAMMGSFVEHLLLYFAAFTSLMSGVAGAYFKVMSKHQTIITFSLLFLCCMCCYYQLFIYEKLLFYGKNERTKNLPASLM